MPCCFVIHKGDDYMSWIFTAFIVASSTIDCEHINKVFNPHLTDFEDIEVYDDLNVKASLAYQGLFEGTEFNCYEITNAKELFQVGSYRRMEGKPLSFESLEAYYLSRTPLKLTSEQEIFAQNLFTSDDLPPVDELHKAFESILKESSYFYLFFDYLHYDAFPIKNHKAYFEHMISNRIKIEYDFVTALNVFVRRFNGVEDPYQNQTNDARAKHVDPICDVVYYIS